MFIFDTNVVLSAIAGPGPPRVCKDNYIQVVNWRITPPVLWYRDIDDDGREMPVTPNSRISNHRLRRQTKTIATTGTGAYADPLHGIRMPIKTASVIRLLRQLHATNLTDFSLIIRLRRHQVNSASAINMVQRWGRGRLW